MAKATSGLQAAEATPPHDRVRHPSTRECTMNRLHRPLTAAVFLLLSLFEIYIGTGLISGAD